MGLSLSWSPSLSFSYVTLNSSNYKKKNWVLYCTSILFINLKRNAIGIILCYINIKEKHAHMTYIHDILSKGIC